MKQIIKVFTNSESKAFKTLKFCLLLFSFLLLDSVEFNAQSVDCVTDATYTTVELKTLLLPKDVDFNEIHVYDIPTLKHKQKTKAHHEYFDQNGNNQHEIILIDAINCHEDWEKASNKWLINQDGITSYISTPKGGDVQFNSIPYNRITSSLYDTIKSNKIKNGILYNKIFPSDLVGGFQKYNLTYTLISTGKYLVQDNLTYTVFDDNVPKSITTFMYDTLGPSQGTLPTHSDPNLKQTDIALFGTNLCNEYFLSKKITMKTDTLSNGICVKYVKSVDYTNYQFSCCSPQPEVVMSQNDLFSSNFLVYPNPLDSDYLKLSLPSGFIGKELIINIFSIDGVKIKEYLINPQIDFHEINIGEYLNSYGLYIIKINSGETTISNQFYYAK